MPNHYLKSFHTLRPQHNLIAQRFGHLTVVSLLGTQNRKYFWECICDCGQTTQATSGDLRSAKRTSCGCERRKHGMSFAPIYSVWRAMMQRCYNPKAKRFSEWGGRGIAVCEHWHTFKNFYADMGDPPFNGASLDRINNDGNYCPENCQWATREQQQRNTRQNHLLTFNGETKSMAEWAELYHLTYPQISKRIQRGWSVEGALTLPRHRRHKKIKQLEPPLLQVE